MYLYNINIKHYVMIFICHDSVTLFADKLIIQQSEIFIIVVLQKADNAGSVQMNIILINDACVITCLHNIWETTLKEHFKIPKFMFTFMINNY